MDNIREKLVGLLTGCGICFHCLPSSIHEEQEKCKIADHLIANGVTVQEQGQWTENQQTTYDSTWGEDVYWYTYTCSVCGSEAMNNFDYCPFCGNPMLSEPLKGE